MGRRVEHAGEGYADQKIVLTLVLAVCASASADNWPRFRGPNGQGLSDDKAIPVKWSQEEVRWKIGLPGGGHSSPVVWGDRVFVTSADEKSLTGTLLCVDAATGKELWRRQQSLARMPMNGLNSYAGATPALDGERVYVAWTGTEQTTLTAWTFEGKEAWTAKLPGTRARHGAGSSPILYGDAVILSCEQDKAGGVLGGWFALDRRTGQMRWRCEHPENPNASYSTPCVFEDGLGRSQLVFTGNLYGIVGVDPAKGEILWKTPNALPARVVSSPVLAGGLIVANCGEGARGIRMAAVKPPTGDSPVGTEVYAIDRGVVSYVPTPVVQGGLLFLFHDQGTVSCLHADTGEVLWSEKPAGRYYGSPICVNGKLYCVTVDGDVVILAAGPKYELLAVNPLGEKSHATPAVAAGRMYLRIFSHLICVGGRR
ncbi:MAG TPA: PQQ-binding-like beta-propeller repeat protein [Sedimentisphaerales bacterium]|nr:PQQ-binding-like beta-propeller repeat protein [Sedimentisphaerales bacterium]